jgi:very-short-patch-repair endonuclease
VPIEVTVPGRDVADRKGIRVHRTRSLQADEVTTRFDAPATSPTRTVIDLAGQVGDDELEWALGCAQRGGAATRGHIVTLIERRPRVRGAARLRRLLEAGPAPFTRSLPERRLLRLLERQGSAKPIANASLAGFEVDLLWPDARLVVEFDGFEHHGDRAAFERDRERDATLAARGYLVIRVTWRQLTREPDAVVTRVTNAYAQRLRLFGGQAA